METEGKASEQETNVPPQDAPPRSSSSGPFDSITTQTSSDRKDEDEEEEEEEEEDKIVEKSHNSRFHKRNKRFPIQIQGVDSAFVAIEPKSGKEVIWNECILSEKKTEKENRYLSLLKRLKRNSHPFLARYLDAWVSKSDDGSRKLVFITERLDECSLKQFLCNSPKNNRSWKRHVGQLLSVLMFLHRLGIPHGNLTKETIYYQNSGNLRVGPFSLGGSLDQKFFAADVHALGIVALEIAVWSSSEFPQPLPPTELCQQMLTRLENNQQRSFIEACLDPTPPVGNRIKRLIHHPAVTEVPILKLLSAKVIVDTLRSVTNEEGSATEQTGFATLLKEYVSHYEDETVIVDVHFPHDNITKSRSWKDFRSNFTLTSKYLEDVKNGFYPLFGCRWQWDAYQDEDEESLVTSTGLGGNGSAASSGWIGRVESAVAPSQMGSSTTSTVPSASVSRKHSTATKTSEPVGVGPVLMEDEGASGEVQSIPATPGRSVSVCDQPSGRLPPAPTRNRQSDLGLSHAPNIPAAHAAPHDENSSPGGPAPAFYVADTLLDASVLQSSIKDIGDAASEQRVGSHSPSPGFGNSLPTAKGSVGSQPQVDLGSNGRSKSTNVPINISDTRHVPPRAVDSQAVPPVSSKEHKISANAQFVHSTDGPAHQAKQLEPVPEPSQSISDKVEHGQDVVDSTPVEEPLGPADEEEDKEEEDEDDENDDEDEDEEDDEKNVSESVERVEPQTIHVVAPERAPNHPALFTHCQYFYVGAGRWQVYVQMWFVEERLKRETYVQVFDYEWHDYERVADLFEASRCLNPVDRPSLLRLLALARHNCPLVDGELHFPGSLNVRPSHFDALELHEKLTALRLHQQAREQLLREAETQENVISRDGPQGLSQPTSDPDTRQPSSGPTEKNTTTTTSAPASIDPPESGNKSVPIQEELPACADHVIQLQEQQRGQLQGTKETDLSKEHPPVIPGAGQPRAELPNLSTTLFLDVGSLAPRNAYCALCDTHDYLHRVDLPAYLISPCYHCREALAKEAKISPEVLLDLHLQHHIPWPAFLQARFNLPNDGRSIEELIAYDCRWRSRQPCRCLVSSGGSLLPPCVEFPWLCPPASSVSSGGSSVTAASGGPDPPVSSGPEVIRHSTTAFELTSSDTPVPVELRPKLSETRSGSPLQVQALGHPTESIPATHTASTRGQQLPCSGRHARGCPTTCCHGIQFPRLGMPVAPAPNRTPPVTTAETSQTIPNATEVPATTAGSSTHPNVSMQLSNGLLP